MPVGQVVDQLNTALANRYEIEREIGAGGMATVYLARDIRHNRKVALKVLKPELGAVLGVERFLAEIQVTANLQHPNLLPLFDSGEANGLLFYVMPFVEGESLRARLDRENQLPVDEVLRIATAAAGALEYAHGHGVIHRDLKPENILLQAGQPIIADFGIALAVSKAGGARITQTGLSLGTPQYMSPEQATGDRAVDGRTDIYSLAAMTYEMLAGEPPHAGPTAQAILAKLMTEDVRPITVLRRSVPVHVDVAVRRGLEKLAADRFATAREFAEALHGRGAPVASDSTVRATPTSRDGGQPTWRSRLRDPVVLGLAALAVVGGALGVRGLSDRPDTPPSIVSRFFLTLPRNQRVIEGGSGSTIAISPDGRLIALLSLTPGGPPNLFIRPIDQLAATSIVTDVARNLTFSPDSRWVAFTVGTLVKKVSVDGGPVATLATLSGVGAMLGLSWRSPTTIIVGTTTGLHEVPAAGGPSRLASRTDSVINEGGKRWPLALDDGKTVIYMSPNASGSAVGAQLAIASLETGQSRRLGVNGTYPLGLLNGLLIYATASGSLMGIPFDGSRATVTGDPIPIADDVVVENVGIARASLSATGTLVYISGASRSQPVLVDARGLATPVLTEPRGYLNPRFSPDGHRTAFTVGTTQGTDVWVHDRPRATFQRLTTEASNARPEWTADGKRILFLSSRDGGSEIWWAPADGSGPAELLYAPPEITNEAFLSPDGQWLVYRTGPGAEHPQNIFAVPIKGDRKPQPVLTGSFRYVMPRLSPDGRWLAYQSDESGPYEIYVRPFPGSGARVQVSTDGGTAVMWDPSGNALYYLRETDVVRVAVTTGVSFSIGERKVVASGDFLADLTHQNYDISPETGQLLMLRRAGDEARTIVVLNWHREVEAKRAAQIAR